MAPRTYLGWHLGIGAAVAAAGFWIFGGLIDAVLDNRVIVHWDMDVSQWIHLRTSPGGLRLWNILTQLGSPSAMTVLGIAGAVLLWRRHHELALTVWTLAFVGGAAMDWVVKQAVHRTRPPFGAAYLHGQTFSFPSGHAMGSLIGYGMVVYLIELFWHPDARAKRTVQTAALMLVLTVGFSRLYLGVHYPSDVAGGWAAGAAWLAVCVSGSTVAMRRQRSSR